MKKLFTAILALYALSAPFSAQANTIKRKICVFDIVGNVGPIMNAMRDWKAAARGWGLETELVPYTNEAIVAEDLKAGICDASLITGIRGRAFNKYAGTVDSIGAIPTMDHMKVLLQVLSHPQSADKLSQGSYQIMGIAPAGAKAAGKKVAVLEYDETQAKLVSQVGATPIASDITNFSTKFNNGVVDIIVAPLVAYSALELYKGLSPDGGIINYPLVQLTFQLIAKKDRFPAEMAQKSREYFYNNLQRITSQLDNEAKHVAKHWWVEIPDADKAEYEVMMQEARDQLRDEGYYDQDMLTLLRKVRCKMEATRAECS
jgi:hypothetical protein